MAENIEFEAIKRANPEGNKENFDPRPNLHNYNDPKNSLVNLKKPSSAFQLFIGEVKSSTQKSLQITDKKNFLAEVSKLWNGLDVNEKQKYIDEAMRLKEIYQE